MNEFKSVHAYHQFSSSIRNRWRFTRDEMQSTFVKAFIETSIKRREVISAGAVLYRAQLGCEWPSAEEEDAGDTLPRGYRPERMKPEKNKASEGRVNPRGIPCLYTATHEITATAEVRPWIGAHISVAQLRTHKDLVIVNCTSDKQGNFIYFSEPEPSEPSEREVAVWRDLDRAFAQPVERDEQSAEYAPTQVLAESLREHGLDGIAYRSSLGPGHNIAFFDLEAADVINCTVHEVRSIELNTSEVTNRYYVSKSLYGYQD